MILKICWQNNRPKWSKYGGYFDIDNLINEIIEEEEIVNQINFWHDPKKAEEIVKKKNQKEKTTSEMIFLKEEIEGNLDLIESLKEEYDQEIKILIEESLIKTEQQLSDLENKFLLSGPYDNHNVIIEIHSGAGGTEANDWVAMLYRMYLKYFEKKNYKVKILGETKGEEVGYKNIIMLVEGEKGYGYLKYEHGVHRLVRISPFDSNARRHTSFAYVDVIPYFEDVVELVVLDEDLKTDVYRSSGAGGQSVNTTDSAVRVTHLPTGIVVTCQNERSQIRNRERAIQVLKNKLWTIEISKKEASLRKIRGDVVDINFGSQIRSYVLHPYMMVKDHRTNTEIGNAMKVLDGDLDELVNANLKNETRD